MCVRLFMYIYICVSTCITRLTFAGSRRLSIQYATRTLQRKRSAHTHDARQRYGDDIRRQILSPIYINFIKHKHKSKVYLCITCVFYACVCVCVLFVVAHASGPPETLRKCKRKEIFSDIYSIVCMCSMHTRHHTPRHGSEPQKYSIRQFTYGVCVCV